MKDPYLYPNSSVLINKADIRDRVKLEKFERLTTAHRMMELVADESAAIAKTPATYQQIHRAIFQDVYSWAGEIREIHLFKGNDAFAFQQFIIPSLKKELNSLESWDFNTISTDEFIERSAHHIGEINAIHPFREGNGRTMRVHLHRLAMASGQKLDITQLTSKEWIQASIEAHQGDVARMKDVIAVAIGREQSILMTTTKKEASSMVEQMVEATSSLSSQSLEAHKERFVVRVSAAMDRNEELAQLGIAERLSLAATVAIEEAREASDSLTAKQQIYTGLSLVADAQDSVQSITEEEKVASDIERFRDTMIEVAQTSSNDDVRAMANRYLPSLDKMVDEAKEQVREQGEDNEIEL